MPRRTRALLWCLALLGLAEAGVRRLDRLRPPVGSMGLEQRLVVVLGTSRSKYGIDPEVLERQLARAGIDDIFVGNASRVAATNIGLLQIWIEDVQPAVESHGRGVVAVELRVEGFNDSYLAEGERLPPGLQASAFELDGPLDMLAEARLDDASWWLLSRLRLTAIPSLLRRLDSLGQASGEEHWRPPWAKGNRGYEPMPRVSTKEFAGTRAHYENKVMADFALGGRQTLALETLVAAIRKVGMQPVLYLMPVTSKHHSLYPGETWDRTLAHIASLAGEWDLPFVDLDRNHGLPLDVFHDTGHLQPAGAEIISTRLVDRVLAAALR